MNKKELIAQGVITKNQVLEYLAEYKYSTPKTISTALNIKYKTLLKALARYDKQELITVINIEYPKTKVVGISWQGLTEIGEVDQTKIFHTSRLNERTLLHWLQCQNYATLRKRKNIKCYLPPVMKFANVGRGNVDLIEENNDFKIGIEIERTPKSIKRYAEVWGGHVQLIQQNKLAGIKYILTTKRAEAVQKIFHKTNYVLINKKKIDFYQFKDHFKFVINNDL